MAKKSAALAREIVAVREQLETWAVSYGLQDDPYITKLDLALEQADDLEFWASIDPMDYLPLNTRRFSSKRLHLARLLAGIRNIIIFVPVAITWAAVGEATRAFNDFVAQNTGTPANFLQFWQDGYGLLDKFWSIGSVATLDFYIVALVILMTGSVAILQSAGQTDIGAISRQFESDRRDLAIEINRLLSVFKPVSAGQLPLELSKSVRELKAAIAENRARKATVAEVRALDKQVKLAEAAVKVTNEMKASNTALRTAAATTAKQIEALQRDLHKKNLS